MKKLFLILVLLSALLASRWLFKPGYFNMHDDLQMMRQLQMEKCWQDNQFPCRWVPDMGFGYGYPLFNFYPPLPYYVGQIFRWLGLTFMTTAKVIFALQFFLSGVTMFILAADLWGDWGGLLSAVFYIWAPYHAVDVFVRGATNEAWAFIWFPLIFWAGKKLVEKEKWRYVFWLALGYGSLLLTHSIMALIFTPAFLAWIAYWLVIEKKYSWRKGRLWGQLTLSGIWALGLSAFFTLPMLFEKEFTHIETMFSGYFDWRAHFVSIKQLFLTRFWGWGPSLWGAEDGMPFPVGHFHWILGLLVFLLVVFSIAQKFFLKKKGRIKNQALLLMGLFLGGLAYAFLAHQRSVFLWRIIKPLQLAQFPWRLLAGCVFFFSLLAGSVWQLVKSYWLIIVLGLGVIVFNWSFFQPESMGPLTDEQKFSGRAWEYQQTAGLYDYLPISARIAPRSAPKTDWLMIGKGESSGGKWEKGTNWARWQGKVEKPGTIQASIFYFPGWRAWVDGKEVEIGHDEELGRMQIKLEAGERQIDFRFVNTPIRSWANFFSLFSWWALLGVAMGPSLWQLIPKN